MSQPHSITLAYQVSALLEGTCWAIGGSTLLYHLGIEPNPSDLDLVVQEEHFVNVAERLASALGPSTRPPDPHYCSKHFARFRSNDGASLDLMAGIASRTPSGIVSWKFLPSRISRREGLPWMVPEDWLELYALFDRPKRVAQLKAYLASPRPNRGPNCSFREIVDMHRQAGVAPGAVRLNPGVDLSRLQLDIRVGGAQQRASNDAN